MERHGATETMQLSQRDAAAFVDALLTDHEPNARLQRAAARYRAARLAYEEKRAGQ